VAVASPAKVASLTIRWSGTPIGPGGVSAGGNFRFFATIGQPDANTVVMTGGDFQLTGGLWPAVACLADIDGDGDTDGDGTTDRSDLGILLANWGNGC